MAAKTLKNPYRLQTVTFKLSLKGKKTNLRKEKPKVSYFVALAVAFIAAENENRQIEDLLQADFGRSPERFFSIGKDKVKFCKLKITPIVVFVIMIQRIFSSLALALTHCPIFILGLLILLLSFIKKVDSSCQ